MYLFKAEAEIGAANMSSNRLITSGVFGASCTASVSLVVFGIE